MRRLLLAVLLLGLLLGTSAAGASAVQFPTVPDATRLADQAFPWSRCAGHLVVIEDPSVAARGDDGWTAMDGTCELRIAPGLEPLRRCDVIVHETWHRATGRIDHELTGPGRAGAWPWPPCHSQRAAAETRIRAGLPRPHRTWSVRCAGSNERLRCRASSPRAKRVRRFEVFVFGDDDFRVFPADRPVRVRGLDVPRR